jgi:FKBP-type peptidyl-prolyl cis-trans isomerase SlyD
MRVKRNSESLLAAAVLLWAAALPATAQDTAKGDETVVEDGKVIGIEYTLTLEDGTVADTNVGRDDLTYTQGSGQILPALEQALAGHAIGDEVNVKIAANDGYGEVNPELRREVSPDQIPEGAREVGQVLVGQGPEGQPIQVRVHEVKDEAIVLDFNHPLAGEDLNFDVTIKSVE